jgi:hypothetical protein
MINYGMAEVWGTLSSYACCFHFTLLFDMTKNKKLNNMVWNTGFRKKYFPTGQTACWSWPSNILYIVQGQTTASLACHISTLIPGLYLWFSVTHTLYTVFPVYRGALGRHKAEWNFDKQDSSRW